MIEGRNTGKRFLGNGTPKARPSICPTQVPPDLGYSLTTYSGSARDRRCTMPALTRSFDFSVRDVSIIGSSSSSERSDTTMLAPCSRNASACPTRSTPTTQAKYPARPASTPASASSKTPASPGATPSARAVQEGVGGWLPLQPLALGHHPVDAGLEELFDASGDQHVAGVGARR